MISRRIACSQTATSTSAGLREDDGGRYPNVMTAWDGPAAKDLRES
jgi:hypothetical protein